MTRRRATLRKPHKSLSSSRAKAAREAQSSTPSGLPGSQTAVMSIWSVAALFISLDWRGRTLLNVWNETQILTHSCPYPQYFVRRFLSRVRQCRLGEFDPASLAPSTGECSRRAVTTLLPRLHRRVARAQEGSERAHDQYVNKESPRSNFGLYGLLIAHSSSCSRSRERRSFASRRSQRGEARRRDDFGPLRPVALSAVVTCSDPPSTCLAVLQKPGCCIHICLVTFCFEEFFSNRDSLNHSAALEPPRLQMRRLCTLPATHSPRAMRTPRRHRILDLSLQQALN